MEKIDFDTPYFKEHPEMAEKVRKLMALDNEKQTWKAAFACEKQCRPGPYGPTLDAEEFVRLYGQDSLCPFFSPDCWAGELGKERKIRALLKERGVPLIYHSVSYRNSRPTRTLKVMKSWEKQDFPQGKSLLLCGGSGIGKTHAVVCFLRHYLENEQGDFCFAYAASFFNRLRFSEYQEKQALLERAKNAELFILDDLAVENRTDYSASLLDEIVWHREGNLLPMIVTSNKSPEELRLILGERVYDRLAAGGTVFSGTGESLRNAAAFRVQGASLSPAHCGGEGGGDLPAITQDWLKIC